MVYFMQTDVSKLYSFEHVTIFLKTEMFYVLFLIRRLRYPVSILTLMAHLTLDETDFNMWQAAAGQVVASFGSAHCCLWGSWASVSSPWVPVKGAGPGPSRG